MILRWTLNDLKESEAKGPRYGPINLGAQKSVSDDITTSNLTLPIVTFTAENAFTMDVSATETYEVPFERTNDTPDEISGQSHMNNAEWITAMRKRVDQWQAQHDGYNLSCPGNENVPSISQNGYIKSFSTTYHCGKPEYISGTLMFQSGSMRCKNERAITVADSNATIIRRGYGVSSDFLKTFIQVTSSDNSRFYTLYCNTDNGEYGCVQSYSLVYGPTDPFPCLKLTISKKRLANIAPDLIDDFKPGKNRISLSACGSGTFIVTKCSLNNQKYTLTAYGVEEAYRGLTLDQDIELRTMSPFEIIKYILKGNYSIGQDIRLSFNDEFIKYSFTREDRWIETTYTEGSTVKPYLFPKGTSLWYVLCVCALKLNCSIWFADRCAYVCDLSNKIEVSNEYFHRFDKTIYLNYVPNSPINQEDINFCKSVQDNPNLGNEGVDSLINSVIIRNASAKEIESTFYGRRETSKNTYGIRSGNTYNIYELSDKDLLQIANNLADRFSDAQQSISFTVTELGDETDENGSVITRWRSYFPHFSQVNEFVDHNTDTIISNRATWNYPNVVLYDKLSLSSVTRKFPEFSSEYTFGRIANTDLAQTTSVIQQAIGNK